MAYAQATVEPFNWRRFLLVVGPGLVVMLADTDAGSLITAAQSGAQWGYKLLTLQVVLIPILYIVQELTVRLGMVTGKGHAQLIKEQYGAIWAWVSTTTLIVSCIGALLTELSGLTGVGALLGVPQTATLALVVTALLIMAVTRSYLSVERIAIFVGAFELVFLLVAWLAHPALNEVASDAVTIPITDSKYLYLASANIGAVIMPWMVFFQQASIVERGLKVRDIASARADTAIGAVITQLVMMAALVAVAATLGKAAGDHKLDTVEEIAAAITPFLGQVGGKILFALGMAGASLVAAIVVTLTAARTLAEVIGAKHSLENDGFRGPVVLRRLCAGARHRRSRRRLGRRSRLAQRRGAGNERAAAADRARLLVPARPAPSKALPPGRDVRLGRRRVDHDHRSVRRLFRRERDLELTGSLADTVSRRPAASRSPLRLLSIRRSVGTGNHPSIFGAVASVTPARARRSNVETSPTVSG